MSYQNIGNLFSQFFLSSYEGLSHGHSSPLTLVVADQWVVLKKHLYQCWLHIYGLLFWMSAAFLCDRRDPDDEKLRALEALSFIDEPNEYYPLWYLHSSDGEHSDEVLLGRPTLDKADDDSREEGATPKNSSSIKRTIRGHFQSIKQKQHSLNEVMRRPFRKQSPPARLTSHSPPVSPTPSLSSSSSSSSSGSAKHGKPTRLIPQYQEIRRSSVSDALLKSLSLRPKAQRSIDTWTLSPQSMNSSNNNSKSYFDGPFVTEPESWEGPPGAQLLTDRLVPPLSPVAPLRRKTAPDISRPKGAA